VADVGWGMIFARNAQEAGDFCLISRRAPPSSPRARSGDPVVRVLGSTSGSAPDTSESAKGES